MAASSPSNFLALNAEAQKKAIETKGESIARGMENLLKDMKQGTGSMTDESVFEVGKNVATSVGAVVFDEVRLAAERLTWEGLLQKFADSGALTFVADTVEDHPEIRALEQGEGDLLAQVRAGVLVDGDLGEVVEAVAIVFMTLAGMNFAPHMMAMRRGTLRFYWADPEIRWYVSVMYTSVLGIAAYLWLAGTYPDFVTALRFAAFNVVSIATTTGYANTDYAQWPFFAPLWMLFLCSFVTCSGSTGGGIKMMRAVILYKQIFREITHAMHPNATTYVLSLIHISEPTRPY